MVRSTTATGSEPTVRPRPVAWLAALLAALAALGSAGQAAAAPEQPWQGRWLGADGNLMTLFQNGSQITGTGSCPGATTPPGDTGVTLSASAGADQVSATFAYSSTVCTGTGGTFTATIAADGVTVTGSGLTQFGTGFQLKWTYQGGGVEPRALPATVCPTPQSPWSGRWLVTSGADPAGTTYVFIQDGARMTTYVQAASIHELGPEYTISSPPGIRSRAQVTDLSGGPVLSLDLLDPRRFEGFITNDQSRKDVGALQGCAQVKSAPDLARTIPSPQTVRAGPTAATAPGRISLGSLKRSKCVKVVVRTTKPARVLATIFSGRRSIRLFGQKEVLFRTAPARKVVCIKVPLRAHTFNVRTPLRFALGYRLGTRPRRPGERPPDPVIRKIQLVP